VIFFLNVALTALSLVTEQNDGTQERVWITGIYIRNEEIFLVLLGFTFFVLEHKVN